MDNKKTQLITLIIMLTTAAVLSAVYIPKGSDQMNIKDVIVQIIIILCTGLVTYIVSWLLSRRSQLHQNTAAIDKLIERLGRFESRTLENMLGITTDESLSGQFKQVVKKLNDDMGVDKAHPSLSFQHDTILDYLRKKDKTAEQRLAAFSLTDKNIHNSLEEIKLFFSDWEIKTDIINQLNEENVRLNAKIAELNAELSLSKSSSSPEHTFFRKR